MATDASEQLYAPIIEPEPAQYDEPPEGANRGSATSATRGTTGTARKRKRSNARATTARAPRQATNRQPTAQPSDEKLEKLAIGIARCVQMAFVVPAMARTAQWGPLPNPVTQEMEQSPGDVWRVPDEEAFAFGAAWADVIDAYLPEESIGQGVMWGTALMATATLVGPRVMVDQMYAQVYRQIAEQRAAADAARARQQEMMAA